MMKKKTLMAYRLVWCRTFLIVGCQQVMQVVVNPINYMVGYNADFWDWSCKGKNHVAVTAGICKSLQ